MMRTALILVAGAAAGVILTRLAFAESIIRAAVDDAARLDARA